MKDSAKSTAEKVNFFPKGCRQNTSYAPGRVFTTDEDPNAYDGIDWELRDVEIKKPDGEVVFSQKGVEIPSNWSINASTIVASKYFRGHGDAREKSVRQLIDRVVCAISAASVDHGYFSADEAQVFEDELRYLCLHQMMAFNSPVWFNVGTASEPQSSACFILDVQDDMDSILEWVKEEGKVFKKGSGAGVNLSNIREKGAKLSGGGHASGPLSFALTADRSAGAVKSGGGNRRAAKMIVMDVDHPDIEEFIETKVEGEKIAQALIAQGFSSDFTDEKGAYALAPWQNGNNSVRVTDEFMNAAIEGKTFNLRSRVNGEVTKKVKAADLFRKIAAAAHSCGDPGIQYSDTINTMHTCPDDGAIVASNPCSEYVFLNNTACNLLSFNLMKFRKEDGSFNTGDLIAASRVAFVAMDILVSMSSYPTAAITRGAKNYRTLGAGYTNLGALLMASGIAYDSDDGRDYAAAIMSLITAVGYSVSGEMAEGKGSFKGFFKNQKAMTGVIATHQSSHQKIIKDDDSHLRELHAAAAGAWASAMAYANSFGFRNAQISVLAPTGTISFLMDCDTTGVEPDLALVKYKKLVGGGTMKIVNQTVGPALKKLGYSDEQASEIIIYVDKNDTIEGAPHLKKTHLDVFDCSITPYNGTRAISPAGHIDMMAACQPFISGAISKTCNLPRDATVDDVMQVYTDAWKKGVKAVAVYRDGSKESQPLNLSGDDKEEVVVEAATTKPQRERLPDNRHAAIHKFGIGGHDGYLTLGYYPDGRLGEVFVNVSKQGSTLNGLLDAWAMMVSMGLQYGMPLATLVNKFRHTTFEPSGFTANADIRSTSSILDYIVRVMEINAVVDTSGGLQTVPAKKKEEEARPPALADDLSAKVSGPPCSDCGSFTVRSGSCYVCQTCGTTTGCG